MNVQMGALCNSCPVMAVLEEQSKRIKELEGRMAEQANEIKDLRTKLSIYENPHTPSSAQRRFEEQSKRETGLSKKRGAPEGHRGATRPWPEPTEFVEVRCERCERCGGRDIEFIEFDPALREDIAPPRRNVVVTRYDRGMYRCHGCGHEFTANHKDCPQKGRFGIHFIVYLTLLKFSLRGVLRRIGRFTGYTNNLEVSATGVHDILLRVGEACRKEYFMTLKQVRSAEWRYIDETGMKVNGRNWWLWIFRTCEDDVLVVIRRSRSGNVLKEILGVECLGAGVADGWRAYNALAVLQRCWAHLLREVDAFKDRPGGEELSKTIHLLFQDLKEFLGKDPPMEERQRQKESWDKEMEEVVERFSRFIELKKPLTYIQNGLGSWYTCLLYPGMEPTNNLGEQAMREHVLIRKIIGTFRSERGAENYQYIASMFATWRLQGKNEYEELENLLRRELCLS